MTGIFLQVRLDSSRLPDKALLELAGIPVIEHAMRALDAVEADLRVLLTTVDSVDALEPLAHKLGWGTYVGSKDDVLNRFVMAGRRFGVSRIIRATGDNPLVSPSMAGAAVDLAESSAASYAGFASLPMGAGVEVLDAEALEIAHEEAVDPWEREHVAPFLYRRPKRFRIEVQEAPQEYQAPQSRITLDTQEDYIFLTSLFHELYSGEPLDLDRIVPWLLNRVPHAR